MTSRNKLHRALDLSAQGAQFLSLNQHELAVEHFVDALKQIKLGLNEDEEEVSSVGCSRQIEENGIAQRLESRLNFRSKAEPVVRHGQQDVHDSCDACWHMVDKAIVFGLSDDTEWNSASSQIFAASLLANTALSCYHLGSQKSNAKFLDTARTLYEKTISCLANSSHDSASVIRAIAMNNLAYLLSCTNLQTKAREVFSDVHEMICSDHLAFSSLIDTEDLEGMALNSVISNICNNVAAKAA